MDINTKLRIKSIFLKVIIITVVMMFIGSVVVYGEPLLISDLDAYEMEPLLSGVVLE